jgi:hypothetical protein
MMVNGVECHSSEAVELWLAAQHDRRKEQAIRDTVE